MAWYRGGTVSMVNGSAVVVGAQTDFVANTSPGEAFLGPDGKTYEVAQVVSATQIILGQIYTGATAQAQGYAILPTQSFARDLALGAAQLLTTFSAVRDGIGAGLVQPGSAASPGLRFANDQDTGLVYYGNNSLGLVGGGIVTAAVNEYGLSGFGYGGAPVNPKAVANFGPYGSVSYDVVAVGTVFGHNFYFGGGNQYYGKVGGRALGLRFGDDGITAFMSVQSGDTPFTPTTVFKIDTAGNMLVGVTAGTTFHRIVKPGVEGSPVAEISGPNSSGVACYVSNSSSYGSSAPSTLKVARNTTNGRSIGAEGTINASGADYAEYIRKAEGCGAIGKGDVCGVDADGFLTRTWAAAVSYVVKSTDPSLVGGDTWGGSLAPRPEEPGEEPIAPGTGPAAPGDDATDEEIAAYKEAADAFVSAAAAFPAEHAAWVKLQAKYEKDLAAWEKALESARVCVDRIAFCGQVPVNVSGDFAVGDYVIAAAAGSGIKAVAVPDAEITFEQYRKRIGKVWAIRDGRAWIDVQHG